MYTFSPDLFQEGFQTFLLNKVMANEPAIVPVLCEIINSNKAEETILHLGDVPQMSVWSGDRKITRLSHAKYSIRPSDFQASIAFSRNHLADDQYGALSKLLGQLAQRAAHHPVKLLVDAIVAGTTAVCYDGSPYFGNTHPARGEQTATQDNLLAGSGSGVANLQTDMATMRSHFRRIVDEANEIIFEDVSNLLVVAPPEMEQDFITVLFINTLSTGGENAYAGMADLWVSGRLTDTNDFYGFLLGSGPMPFVFVNREPLQVSSTGLDPSQWANSKEVIVGVDYRAAVGYLAWQCAVKFVN